MLLVHGLYRFGRRKTGARKDFCNCCEKECLAERWRSFNFVHLFWVPFFPLGWHQRWYCTLCKQDPRKQYRTRLGFKIAGLIALPPFLLAMFAAKVKPEDAGATWPMRIVLSLGFVGLLYSVFKKKPALSEDERRSRVIPLSSDYCVYCGGPLVTNPRLRCERCQIEIHTLQCSPPINPSRLASQRVKS